MKEPRYLASLLISIEVMSEDDAHLFSDELLKVTGIAEVILHYKEAVLYVKVDNQILDKEKLQALMNTHINAYQNVV